MDRGPRCAGHDREQQRVANGLDPDVRLQLVGQDPDELRPEAEGPHASVRWNGRDQSGRTVAPGIYMVRAEAGGRSATRRVIRMR